MKRWLERLRHDLVKHPAWRARDLAELLGAGGVARPGDVAALRRAVLELPDGEGRPAGLAAAWRGLRADFDDELPGEVDEAARAALARALDAFGEALAAVEARVAASSEEPSSAPALCEVVLSLEGALERLAHDVNRALAT